MDLEGIMLSEMSDRERETLFDFTYMWNPENKTREQIQQNRPEYWSGWRFPFPGDLRNPRIEPRSPTLQVDSL